MAGLSRSNGVAAWPAVVAAAVAVALAVTGSAQEPSGEDGRRAFFEPVEVPLVSVSVSVTDRQGRPVLGLSAEDFEVLEDGEPVAITHFQAAAETAPGADPGSGGQPQSPELTSPSDRLLLAVWVDDTALRAERRRDALENLHEFLTEQLPEDVQVALASFDGGIRMHQTFTDRRGEVATALEALIERGASVSRLDEERVLIRRIQNSARSSSVMGSGGLEVQSSDLLGEVQAYAAQAYSRAKLSMDNLGRFVDSLAVLPGHKVVLVVSDALNTRPGQRVFAELQQALGDQSGVAGLSSLNFGRRYDLTRELRELLRRANTGRVTFMTLSSMTERVLGLTSAEGRGGSTADLDQIMVEEQAVQAMAGVTGGRVLENSPGLTSQLEDVAREVVSYYSVGYPPPSPGDGEYHRIEIRVKREGVQVRHREGYLGVGAADDLVERTAAAAILDVVENPLGVAVELMPAEPREDDTFLVPTLVRVPIGELVLVPGPDSHEGRVSLAVIVRSADGGLSEPEERQYPIVVPNHELVRATTSSAGYTLGLVMAPGPHRIAVGVRDDLGGLVTTAVASLDVGASP